MPASVVCDQCGYDLCGVPLEQQTVRCPECSHLNVPGLQVPPRVSLVLLASLAPALMLIFFIALSLLLRLWSVVGGGVGVVVALGLYCPASIGVGIATGFSEYGKPPPYWRKWWHKPALIAFVLAANGLVAGITIGLM